MTTTPAAATELLGADFCRVRSRLRQLGRCFQTGHPCLGNGDRIGVEREALTGR